MDRPALLFPVPAVLPPAPLPSLCQTLASPVESSIGILLRTACIIPAAASRTRTLVHSSLYCRSSRSVSFSRTFCAASGVPALLRPVWCYDGSQHVTVVMLPCVRLFQFFRIIVRSDFGITVRFSFRIIVRFGFRIIVRFDFRIIVPFGFRRSLFKRHSAA